VKILGIIYGNDNKLDTTTSYFKVVAKTTSGKSLTGYVETTGITFTTIKRMEYQACTTKAKVTGDGVNLRAMPTTDDTVYEVKGSNIITTLSSGTKLTVLGHVDSYRGVRYTCPNNEYIDFGDAWLKVKVKVGKKTKTGYINAKYVEV
jgi:hypothetical protein